jgi:hypothetical protein
MINIMLAFGFNRNNFYKGIAEKTIIHISNLKLSEEQEQRELSYRSGTSILWVILILVWLVLIAAISKSQTVCKKGKK